MLYSCAEVGTIAAYQISGGKPLNGSLVIQGSKNAALPLIAAALLHRGITILHRCPNIMDVRYMIEILRSIGCEIEWSQDMLRIDASEIYVDHLLETCVGKMRSSILLSGAILGRCENLTLDYPGGCTIGERPIDFHLNALKYMGVHIDDQGDRIICSRKELVGRPIVLAYPSVGATENIMMAAVHAKGVTWIYNAAKEPEVVDLACFLRSMGVKIYGAGTDCIGIYGGCPLRDVEYTIMGDRIVAGTYLLAAAATKGNIEVKGVSVKHLQILLHICEEMGCQVCLTDQGIRLEARHRLFSVNDIHTHPFPGFPTDMQSQMLSVLSMARGESVLYEHVFENRFQTVEELVRMGADIQIKKNRAVIRGVDKLRGCTVSAKDLRGGAALVIAGLAAEGDTIVENSIFVERGYQDICKDLEQLGAVIKIMNGK